MRSYDMQRVSNQRDSYDDDPFEDLYWEEEMMERGRQAGARARRTTLSSQIEEYLRHM